MSVQQVLEAIRTQLPAWRTATLNEAQTSQVIILRLIQALGYDIWNPNEVFPQEAANGNIPDFIVLHDDTRRFIVEVKKLDTPLTDRMKTQAVSYANNQAIQWAVLTNGAEWLLFDSFMVSQPAHNRLVLSLSLDNHDYVSSSYGTTQL
jgi:predicted type IV restriction endonuclease